MIKMENEIELNGKKYVLKENVEHKKHKVFFVENKFSLKDETKLHQKFMKLFAGVDEPVSEEDVLNAKDVIVITSCNVGMVVAKTERAKLFLRSYVDEFQLTKQNPKLDYKCIVDEENRVRLSSCYIWKIFDIVKLLEQINDKDESVDILIKKEYPITIETEDFKFVVAPRVLND
jgi:hypothetical protein